MFRKIILSLLAGLFLLAAIVLFNTFRLVSQPIDIQPNGSIPLPSGAVQHLQQAVRFRTVSVDTATPPDSSQFLGFHRFLQQAYPLVHTHLGRETVNTYSLLYKWAGTDASLPPAVFMAHLDVVPVESESLSRWHYPPFSGEVRQNQIWGRGTADNKGNLIAMLEAIEQLLRTGYRPGRTVYFAFGHDEELGGQRGAQQIARLLQQRGQKPEFVLDEGSWVTTQKLPGLVGKPVALIATAEKGTLSLEISANVAGGHSSMPESETALGLVAQALTTLQQHSFPSRLTPAMQDFAAHVGPHMPFVQRIAFANPWLFEPLILKTYSKTAVGAAMVHTTMVPTVFRSGMKVNVVPSVASAIVNFRILPGTSANAVWAQVCTWLPDKRLTIRPVGPMAEAPAASSTSTLGYRILAKQIRRLVPGVVPTPFLSVGLSDSRYFLPLSPNVYRFSPFTDPAGMHILNERLSVASYQQAIGFYYGILLDLRGRAPAISAEQTL